MDEVKKAIYKVFNKWNSEYPAVAIKQKSRMLLMQEGLNKFSSSDVDRINFDWIKELMGEAKFIHAFNRPLVGGGSGGSGARGNPYRRKLSNEKLKPDWYFWGKMPSVTLQQAVFLSLGIEPDVQQKLMREIDKARRYQQYAEARELLILHDMIDKRQRIAEKYVNNEKLTLMEFLTILDGLQLYYSDQFKMSAQRAEEARILLGDISRKSVDFDLPDEFPRTIQKQEPNPISPEKVKPEPIPIKGNSGKLDDWILWHIEHECGLDIKCKLPYGFQSELVKQAVQRTGYSESSIIKAWGRLELESVHKTRNKHK